MTVEQKVPLALVDDPAWLTEQIRLRGRMWSTDDQRVLVTLWWYSASAWTIGPTLASLVRGEPVLSSRVSDLMLHWLPDSRITGATSTRACADGPDRVGSAAATLRELYEHVIPVLAAHAGIRERPLWAIAADAVATRLLALGRERGSSPAEVVAVTDLLSPLSEAIGLPLPVTRYARTHDPVVEMYTKRCSCCLLYLAPGCEKCDSCPKGGRLRLRDASCS